MLNMKSCVSKLSPAFPLMLQTHLASCSNIPLALVTTLVVVVVVIVEVAVVVETSPPPPHVTHQTDPGCSISGGAALPGLMFPMFS